MSIPATFLKSLRPDSFNGRYRDNRAEDWLDRFDRYCNLIQVAETGQDRILCASMLLIDAASRWYKQLGTITEATINGRRLTPYQVFQYKFRQRFVNANDAEDAFDQIRDLRQKRSVTEYVTLFEKFRSRLDDFDDKDAVRFFRGGLKPELRQLVDNHPDIADDDINGLIALAERLDKMNKSERQFSRSNRQKYNFVQTSVKEEKFPQPMEIDAVKAHPNAQSKFQRPMSKEEIRQNDFANDLCFYCHQPKHLISSCPARNKKSSNSKAH